MNSLEIVLRNKNDETITLEFEIYNNPLAKFWCNLLKQNLILKKIFKKHACFLGWVNNKNRNWNDLVKDINCNLKNLQELFPDKVADVVISHNINELNSEFFNYTHQIFAELLGHNKSITQEFSNSGKYERWEIVKLNHLSHELQAYVENIKYESNGIIRPFINGHFYKGTQKKIPSDLNSFFSIGNRWGEIYIGSIDVGKNYFDAYADNDEDVDSDHLMNISIGTGEFNIHFSEYNFDESEMENFLSWLRIKNVDTSDPSIRLGTGKVGIFKNIIGFEHASRHEILDIISQYDDVYCIRLKLDKIFENIYDYNRFEPQIEIEQLK